MARQKRTAATKLRSRTVQGAARLSAIDRPQSRRSATDQRESSKVAVLKVAKATFEGLATLLTQHGITSPEAETLLRAVCVHETAKAHTSSGRRTNVSRVSVKTGLSRQVVSALLKNPPEADGGLSMRRDSMRRVIDGWLSDPDYSKKGRPRDLEIGGPSSKGRDAWTLIQRYAPGVWPRLIIDELIRLDYVHTGSNGRLRWKGSATGRLVSRQDALEAGDQQLRDAVRAAFLDSGQRHAKRSWRTAQSVNITRSDLPLVRKMLRDRLDAVIAWLTEELNSPRWRARAPKGGRVRVGLSGFIFEEPLSNELASGSEKTRLRARR